MSSEIENAFQARPWSVSGAMFGLDGHLDDEGRPVSERRALSSVKRNVEILLRDCPYRGARYGHAMNVSALAQITRHLKGVVLELVAFRAACGGGLSWPATLTTVIDSVAAPAIQILRQGVNEGAVSARCAVKHKLGAGYLGALCQLLRVEASGEHRRVSVESFLDFVETRNLLVGASEVCAGPENLIRNVSQALIVPSTNTEGIERNDRFDLAETISLQILVGIVWELYDVATERAFTAGRKIEAFRPRNQFVGRRFQERLVQLETSVQIPRGTFEPELPPAAGVGGRLRKALKASEDDFSDVAGLVHQLLGFGEGAVQLSTQVERLSLGRKLGKYLHVYREVATIQWELEKRLRGLLAFDLNVPLKFNALLLPAPKWLDWVDVILGYYVKLGVSPGFSIRLSNHRRSYSVFGD